MSAKIKFAFDKSARVFDSAGRLHIDRSHISKAAVNPYYGSEIPGAEALGLDLGKTYRLFRDPVELERGADSFARLPILSKHVPISATDLPKDLIVGSIGSAVTFSAPYLDADLCVWDSAAIGGIETDTVRELSCAYQYVPVMEPGEYDGQPYDGRMTEIRGNHLALVEVGRAGSDVIVADHNPFKRKSAMKMTKAGKALFAALVLASPALAMDAALPKLVSNVSPKSTDKAALSAAVLALDSDMNAEQVDAVIDAILGVEDNPAPVTPATPASDASPAEQVRAMLAGKCDDEIIEKIVAMVSAPASDEDPDESDDKLKHAMDAMRAEFRDMTEALREVRPVVGEVIGMDSAQDVYRFALDHLKIDHAGVSGTPALRALLRAGTRQTPAPKPASIIAQDAMTDAAKRFPGLSRFVQA